MSGLVGLPIAALLLVYIFFIGPFIYLLILFFFDQGSKIFFSFLGDRFNLSKDDLNIHVLWAKITNAFIIGSLIYTYVSILIWLTQIFVKIVYS